MAELLHCVTIFGVHWIVPGMAGCVEWHPLAPFGSISLSGRLYRGQRIRRVTERLLLRGLGEIAERVAE